MSVAGIQRAIFPMKYVNITQKWGSGTHRYGYPIDNAGKDTGIDALFAPFDGVVMKIWENGHTVWLQSALPVRFANGVVDFATIAVTHDNYVADLRVGQIIRQGQVFYQEGTAGQATGNHVHLECARGKFAGTGWYQASNGQWVINNAIKPTDLFVLTSDNVVRQTLGLKFKGEETKDMVTALTAEVIYRWGLGVSTTDWGKKNAIGKITDEELIAHIKASGEFKRREALAREGKLDIVNHLPEALRKIMT